MQLLKLIADFAETICQIANLNAYVNQRHGDDCKRTILRLVSNVAKIGLHRNGKASDFQASNKLPAWLKFSESSKPNTVNILMQLQLGPPTIITFSSNRF